MMADADLIEYALPLPCPCNIDGLASALAAGLGEGYAGLATGRGLARLLFTQPVSETQSTLATAIFDAHDPAVLTEAQAASAERAATVASLTAELAEADMNVPLDAAQQEKAIRLLLLKNVL